MHTGGYRLVKVDESVFIDTYDVKVRNILLTRVKNINAINVNMFVTGRTQ